MKTKITALLVVATIGATIAAPLRKSPRIAAAMLDQNAGQLASAVKRDSSEILWLARCLYSESRQPHEMFFVAWVVRNRVRSAYWGKTTYQTVVNEPHQFTGIGRYRGLEYTSVLGNPAETAAWRTAVQIARRVYYAEPYENPLPRQARHFLTPEALDSLPRWTTEGRRVTVYGVDPDRLRIYEGL
jgi:spore germination cell wall hydrolase CwlJ-like protein